jgi:hypothetical protein
VSGVTIVAMRSRVFLSRTLALAASRRRWSSFSRSAFLHLLHEDAVLLDEVLDHLGLVAADPAGESQEQGPKGMDGGHGRVILGRCKGLPMPELRRG